MSGLTLIVTSPTSPTKQQTPQILVARTAAIRADKAPDVSSDAIDTDAMRQLAQRFQRIRLGRIDQCIGAELPRPLQALGIDVDGDHARVHGMRKLPNRSLAENRDRLTCR